MIFPKVPLVTEISVLSIVSASTIVILNSSPGARPLKLNLVDVPSVFWKEEVFEDDPNPVSICTVTTPVYIKSDFLDVSSSIPRGIAGVFLITVICFSSISIPEAKDIPCFSFINFV